MINPQKPVINPIKNVNSFTALKKIPATNAVDCFGSTKYVLNKWTADVAC